MGLGPEDVSLLDSSLWASFIEISQFIFSSADWSIEQQSMAGHQKRCRSISFIWWQRAGPPAPGTVPLLPTLLWYRIHCHWDWQRGPPQRSERSTATSYQAGTCCCRREVSEENGVVSWLCPAYQKYKGKCKSSTVKKQKSIPRLCPLAHNHVQMCMYNQWMTFGLGSKGHTHMHMIALRGREPGNKFTELRQTRFKPSGPV